MRRIVVIGGVAAGPAAAARAAKQDPTAEVTLVDAGEHIGLGVCDLPWLLSEGRSREEPAHWPVDRFEREKRVRVCSGHRAMAFDTRSRRVTVVDRAGRLRELVFDALVLATGARAVTAGISLERTLRSPADLAVMRAVLARAPGGRAVVLGSGYLGLEVADVLRARGLSVAVYDREALPLGGLHEEGQQRVLAAMTARGVSFHGGVQLGPGWIEGADIVVSALGTEPEVSLAKAAGIELGGSGALRVDARCETSASGIFAAGDCIETRHQVDGGPVRSTLATAANESGRVAGTNAAGGGARFDGITGSHVFRAFGVEVGKVGFTEAEARRRGLEARATVIEAPVRGGPDAPTVQVSLTVERPTGRILGASAVGEEGAASRIHGATIAIVAGLTASQLASVDLGYAPPVAPRLDPLRIAARQAEARRRR